MEDQLRVEGKVYHMKKQMDKICKELLNKYKIHKVLKKYKKQIFILFSKLQYIKRYHKLIKLKKSL